MRIWIIASFFLLGGVILIWVGIKYRQGYNKHHFLAPIVRLGNIAWMSLPLGIMCILWGMAMVLPVEFGWLSIILLMLGLGIAFMGLLFAIFQVSFMKPSWLRWLEREYSDIMPILRQEAKEIGLNAWNEQIQTQADLEEWVAEVRRKHGV